MKEAQHYELKGWSQPREAGEGCQPFRFPVGPKALNRSTDKKQTVGGLARGRFQQITKERREEKSEVNRELYPIG